MKPTSLDRFKGHKPVVETGQIDPWELSWRYDDPEQPDLVLRVEDMPGCPTISRALFGAFYEETGSVLPITRRLHASELRDFIEFLTERKTTDALASLNDSVLSEYHTHLAAVGITTTAGRWKNSRLSKNTQRKRYRFIERLVITAGRLHGTTIHEKTNPYPGASRTAKAKPTLSPIALIRILFAAKREVREVWSTFESVKDLDRASPLGTACELAATTYGGIWPAGAARMSHKLRNITKQCGGVDRISRHLHATIETITPFLILLAYETVANAWALLDFPEDCVSDDPLFDTRSLISWDTKRRSKFAQSVSRDHRGAFSAPALIKKVRALRAPLVPHASSAYRDKLFLVRTDKRGVVVIGKVVAWNAVQAFIKRNNICEEDGSPVKFTLDMMRPSVLAEVYRRTQDLLVTFRLAGHVSFRTTVQYIIDRATDEMHDAAIAEVQDKLAKAVRDIEDESEEITEDATGGMVWPGNERDCKDPYNGAGPFSKKGILCPTWFFPYTHSGLAVPNEVVYITTILRRKAQFESMRDVWLPERFAIACEPALRIIIEDILPNIDPNVVKEASVRAAQLPPLPVFPDV